MITPSFAPTATERVLPKLALDFTTASLDPRITFTRALATATRINSNGYIESVAADTPRFDYTLNTGGACNGLLIEEARTNIAIYSQSPTNWFKAGTATVSGTAQTSPDGTSNAYPITTCEGYANRFGSSGSLSITGGSTITFSIYIKGNGNGTGATLGLATAGGTYKEQYTAVTITSNWARYSITMTTNADNTGVYWIVYGSTGTTSMVPWGVQVEAGAFATSYIPTTTTTLTRNADVATMTGTNFSSWWSGNGSVTVSIGNITKTSYTTAVVLDNGSGLSGNAVMLQSNSANNKLDTVIYTSGAQTQINDTQTFNTTLTKASMAVNTNYVSYATQGAATTVNTGTLTVPSLNRCVFGYEQRFGNFLNGCIKKFAYYSNVLIANEVQAFSK